MTPTPIASLLANPTLALLARAALTCAYWWGGLVKLFDWSGAIAEAKHFGLEPAAIVVVATILVEIGGSLLVILGRWVWLAAGALGVFTALATLIAYPFWQLTDPVARFHATNSFLEHVGLIGGLMLAAILAERSASFRKDK